MDCVCRPWETYLRYSDTKDRFFNHVISVISVVLRGTTLTILDSTGELLSKEYEKVIVVSLSAIKYPR